MNGVCQVQKTVVLGRAQWSVEFENIIERMVRPALEKKPWIIEILTRLAEREKGHCFGVTRFGRANSGMWKMP